MTDKSFAAGRERVLAHRRKPRQWLKIAAVAAGVALVASAAVLIQPGESDTLQTAHSPETVLDKAAGLVRDPDLAPGQYRYVRVVETDSQVTFETTGCTRNGRRILETWIPQASAAEWLQRISHDQPQCGPFASQERPVESLGEYARFPLPQSRWNDLTPQFLAGLPHDPQAMYTWMTQFVRTSLAQSVPELVSRGYMLPADLRATLYRAMKHMPGITVTEQSVTIEGRAGIAVGLPAAAGKPARREDLVLSVEDGSVIAHRIHTFGGDLARTDVFTYGIAGKIGEPPPR